MSNESLILKLREACDGNGTASIPDDTYALPLHVVEELIRAHQAEQPQDTMERVAKAICPLPVPWDKLNDDCKEIWRGYAKAAIAAMGHVKESLTTDHLREATKMIPQTLNGYADKFYELFHKMPESVRKSLSLHQMRSIFEYMVKPLLEPARSEFSVHPALANAAEILANFKGEPDSTKLEEWQAAYAMLFTQMNEICNQREIPVDDTIKHFAMLWHEYALCPDDKLSGDALELKRKVLEVIPQQRDIPALDVKKIRRMVMTAIRSYGFSSQDKASLESRTDGVMIVLGEEVFPYLKRDLLAHDEELIAKGWFQKQVAQAQKDVLAWPQWLKDHLADGVPARESEGGKS